MFSFCATVSIPGSPLLVHATCPQTGQTYVPHQNEFNQGEIP